MDFEVGLHAGSRADKAKEALHFVGHELEVGRAGQRHELLKESAHLARPCAAMRPAAGCRTKGVAFPEPDAAEFIEPCLADTEGLGGSGGIHAPVVETGENAMDKFGRQPVGKLSLFIPAQCTQAPRPRQAAARGAPSRTRGSDASQEASATLRPPAMRRSHAPSGASPLHSAFVPSPVHFCSGPDSPVVRWRRETGK